MSENWEYKVKKIKEEGKLLATFSFPVVEKMFPVEVFGLSCIC